ncbi:GlgB N-terminal domain-containing protein, partial [Bordetella pertussis]|uniref:GlgB N-terminal domain-containing protein n=1 Tax=Bordetella pertussis TaxID=520 RepID=UPI000AC1A33D
MMRDSPSIQGTLDAATQHALLAGRHADPFSVLGPHQAGAHTVVRAFGPVLDAAQLDHCAAGGWRYLAGLLG